MTPKRCSSRPLPQEQRKSSLFPRITAGALDASPTRLVTIGRLGSRFAELSLSMRTAPERNGPSGRLWLTWTALRSQKDDEHEKGDSHEPQRRSGDTDGQPDRCRGSPRETWGPLLPAPTRSRRPSVGRLLRTGLWLEDMRA